MSKLAVGVFVNRHVGSKGMANYQANCDCDKSCPADSMSCGNGSERTLHPFELFGEDWPAWGRDYAAEPAETAEGAGAAGLELPGA